MSGRARPHDELSTWCELRLEGCTGRATCRHHILRRSQGGTDDAGNTLDLDDNCHRRIHDFPAEAFARGWLKHSWEVA